MGVVSNNVESPCVQRSGSEQENEPGARGTSVQMAVRVSFRPTSLDWADIGARHDGLGVQVSGLLTPC